MSEDPPPRGGLAVAPRVAMTRTVALASVIGLVVLGLAWELALAPTGRGTLVLKVLPVAFAVPGLLKWRLYTCRWLSLVVWLYVAEGVVRLRDGAPHVPLMAAIELALAGTLFIACALQVRWRLAAGHAADARAARHAAGAAQDAPGTP